VKSNRSSQCRLPLSPFWPKSRFAAEAARSLGSASTCGRRQACGVLGTCAASRRTRIAPPSEDHLLALSCNTQGTER
jgi:hypothetical protein